jgi:hypothetical protein
MAIPAVFVRRGINLGERQVERIFDDQRQAAARLCAFCRLMMRTANPKKCDQ